jgi:ASPIC and UnbV
VLSDPSKSDGFRKSSHWRSPLLDFKLRVKQDAGLAFSAGEAGPAWRSNSFSGHERNRFLLRGRNGFHDLSLLSDVDCLEDERSFAMLDYDGDGWLDIALMSMQAPRFRLFRNRIGSLTSGGRVVSLRLHGGNRTAAPGSSSTRDAVGAMVTAVTSAGRRVFRRSIGEGLAAQNAAAIRVTVAPGEQWHELEVRWPSGRTSTRKVETDARVVVIEEGEP